MTIAVGEKLPDAKFKTMTADGAKELSTADIFAGKKVVLFGVPGAFTPTCSNNHLPGYLENFDAIKARGIDEIAVIATNDVHVMGAWARFTGGEGKILYLADGSGDFARAPPDWMSTSARPGWASATSASRWSPRTAWSRR